VPDADKATLRAQLVPSIIALSGASDKAVRAQVAETVAVIAKYDFPEQWTELVDVRLSCTYSKFLIIYVFYAVRRLTIKNQRNLATRPISFPITFRLRDEPVNSRNSALHLLPLAR